MQVHGSYNFQPISPWVKRVDLAMKNHAIPLIAFKVQKQENTPKSVGSFEKQGEEALYRNWLYQLSQEPGFAMNK